ncbi:MAG TPA: c-type cytochrome [Vicinamibacterales bacterium]|nr:c-type cytochrome [Vicinamibacterales bacterium]
MAWRNVLRVTLLFGAVAAVSAALSAQSPTFGVGRAPTAEEIRAWDIAIRPDGAELPQGHGTSKEGAALYTQKGCAGCHGRTGSGSMAPTLIKSDGTNKNAPPCLAPCVNDNNVMALHSPYSTVLWDYINRAMPIGKEGTLAPNEVYSLAAYVLFKNGVIKEDDVMDQQSLPKVVMPNLKGYALPAQPWKHGAPRLLNYP